MTFSGSADDLEEFEPLHVLGDALSGGEGEVVLELFEVDLAAQVGAETVEVVLGIRRH